MERIDWNLPLETDEPTPRKATPIKQDEISGQWLVELAATEKLSRCRWWFYTDGSYMGGPFVDLRNVRALRTSDECLQRMEALVRRMAARYETRPPGHVDPNDAEAAQIVKLLPAPPVDPDLIEARKIADAATGIRLDGIFPDLHNAALEAIRGAVLQGVKRGRELAADGQ